MKCNRCGTTRLEAIYPVAGWITVDGKRVATIKHICYVCKILKEMEDQRRDVVRR
jgi:hypothetical protein